MNPAQCKVLHFKYVIYFSPQLYKVNTLFPNMSLTQLVRSIHRITQPIIDTAVTWTLVTFSDMSSLSMKVLEEEWDFWFQNGGIQESWHHNPLQKIKKNEHTAQNYHQQSFKTQIWRWDSPQGHRKVKEKKRKKKLQADGKRIRLPHSQCPSPHSAQHQVSRKFLPNSQFLYWKWWLSTWISLSPPS